MLHFALSSRTLVASLAVCSSALLAGCLGSGEEGDGSSGGGGGGRGVTTYTISGTVSGLAGSGLILHNGADNLGVDKDGSFTFTTPVGAGSSYAVSVFSQPTAPSQTCTVANGSGSAVSANVTNVTVTCVTNSYTVTATVLGVSGTGLVLQNNGGDNLNVPGSGAFTFSTPVASGAAYNISVATQPAGPAQTCTVGSGSGTMGGGNVTSVVVSCTTSLYTVSGTVSGLAGGGLVLQNNYGDSLLVSASGSFTFPTRIANMPSSGYSVTVFAQPSGPAQTCTVTNGLGVAVSANVTNVAVNCVTNSYTVTATVLGVTGTGLVLQNNGGDNLSIPGSGAFTFATPIISGVAYNVTVLSQPLSPSQTCTVSSGSAIMGGGNVSNVIVSCITNRYSVGGSVSGLIGTLVLQNNFGDNLSVGANGTFTFATTLPSMTSYSVTRLSQPAGLSCAVSNGAGVVTTGPIANVSVTCALTAPTLGTTPLGPKKVQFSWGANPLATHYRLFENPDGASGYTQIGGDLTGTSYDLDLAGVLLTRRANASYLVEVCNNATCVASTPVQFTAVLANVVGYFKASNTASNDYFGAWVALSADGSTMAVGAPEEDSNATGINGDQADNTRLNSGAVYVFVRSGGVWSQQAYVKASNTGNPPSITAASGAGFGYTIDLSADGNTLAIGAPLEGSAASGVGGNQTYDCSLAIPVNCATYSGAAYVFTRSGTTWSQQAYLKPFNTSAAGNVQMNFGAALRLSADGNLLAVGAPGEGSATTGVGGNASYTCDGAGPVNCANASGAAYTFTRSGAAWSMQTYFKAANAEANERFGRTLALSGDGTTLAVAAPGEDSGAKTIDGNPVDDCGTTNVNCASNSGAVYVFAFSGTWAQQAYIKASNADANDFLGGSPSVGLTWIGVTFPITIGGIALSNDGNTLAVGALNESSAATGINGTQTDNSLASSGAVYVFTRAVATWSQQAYIKASNTGASDSFGVALGLSADGNLLVVGAGGEDSAATGLNGNPADNSVPESGAAYVFARSGVNWSQQTYVKAPNTRSSYRFGRALAVSGDGSTLAVGALNEASGVTGIGGNQNDTAFPGAGAVYLY